VGNRDSIILKLPVHLGGDRVLVREDCRWGNGEADQLRNCGSDISFVRNFDQQLIGDGNAGRRERLCKSKHSVEDAAVEPFPQDGDPTVPKLHQMLCQFVAAGCIIARDHIHLVCALHPPQDNGRCPRRDQCIDLVPCNQTLFSAHQQDPIHTVLVKG